MTQRARRWFYLLATLVFGLVGPALLLSAQGYRLDVRRLRVLRTGGLVVTSFPDNAPVVFDGQPLNRRTPTQLIARFPGAYRLLLQRPGFQDWSTDVTVRAGQTQKVEATLLPANPRQTVFNFEQIQAVAAGPGERLGLIVRHDGQSLLGVIRSGTDWRPLTHLQLPDSVQPVLAWSTRGNFTAVLVPGRSLAIVDAATGQNLTPAAARQGFDRVVWDPENDRQLYATVSGSLWRVDLVAGIAQVVASPNVQAVAVGRGELWILRQSLPTPQLQRLSTLTINRVELAISLAADHGFTDIAALHRHGLVLSGPERVGLFDRRSDSIKILPLSGLIRTTVETAESSVLLATPTELWAVSLPDATESLLARQSSLSDASWYPKRAVVLLLANELLRTEDPGARGAAGGQLGPFPGGRRLYYIGDRMVVIESDQALTAFRLS